jgi:hypothetical protein
MLVCRIWPTDIGIFWLVLEFIITNIRDYKEWGTCISLSANYSIVLPLLAYWQKEAW